MPNDAKHRAKLLLFWLWQVLWGAPQTLLGLVVRLVCAAREMPRGWYHGASVTYWPLTTSMSAGPFLFVSADVGEATAQRLTAHEYGHSVQSLLLGPLYLPLILLPSALWCRLPAARRHRSAKHRGYYTFYTERWANHLAAKVTGDDLPDWM